MDYPFFKCTVQWQQQRKLSLFFALLLLLVACVYRWTRNDYYFAKEGVPATLKARTAGEMQTSSTPAIPSILKLTFELSLSLSLSFSFKGIKKQLLSYRFLVAQHTHTHRFHEHRPKVSFFV